jgi:hypothetical protein
VYPFQYTGSSLSDSWPSQLLPFRGWTEAMATPQDLWRVSIWKQVCGIRHHVEV